MNCPKCGGGMSRVALPSGVEIDACEDHGVWLDVGELQQILAFQAQRGGGRGAGGMGGMGGRGRRAPEPPSLASKMATGVATGMARGAGAGLASSLIRSLFR